jgi:hypothetical protein
LFSPERSLFAPAELLFNVPIAISWGAACSAEVMNRVLRAMNSAVGLNTKNPLEVYAHC